MINNPLSLDKAIEILNSLVVLDREAITNLIETRVFCNNALADHSTAQCHSYNKDGRLVNTIGLLGVLNAIFGNYDSGPRVKWGPIAAYYDQTANRLLGFKITPNEE